MMLYSWSNTREILGGLQAGTVPNRKEVSKKVLVKDSDPCGKETVYVQLLLSGKW